MNQHIIIKQTGLLKTLDTIAIPGREVCSFQENLLGQWMKLLSIVL